MSIVNDKTPIILNQINKTGLDFQKRFKTKFSLINFSQTYSFNKFS